MCNLDHVFGHRSKKYFWILMKPHVSRSKEIRNYFLVSFISQFLKCNGNASFYCLHRNSTECD